MKKASLTIIGWVISITLLSTIFTRLDLRAVWEELLKARWAFLLLAAVINISVIAVRTLRWKLLLKPAITIPFRQLFQAITIGFAGNNVLPARGGDWYKIYLLNKWSKAGAAIFASAMGLDKLFDGLAILILFGALSLHSHFPIWVQRGTTIVSIIVAISFATCVLLLLHHRRTSAGDFKPLKPLSLIAKKLGSGMGVLASTRLVAQALAISILNCALQMTVIWCCQMAFGVHLDIWVPALIYVAINVAIIIPSAPSDIGTFEAAAVLAYTWLGITKETGFDIALMYHAVQFFPVTILGFIFYLWNLKITPTKSAALEYAAK